AALGIDLETGGEDREALDEPAREDPVAREDIAEATPEQAGEKPGEDSISERVAAAIRLLLLVAPGADDHVELLGEQLVDHRRGGLGVIGQIAVRHDVNVGVDVGEHPADDMTLALLTLAANNCAGLGGDLAGAVGAVVVVNVD